ncbi:MAG: winged helix-turn-helix transcriptional regulator [Candidatus Lokiarchaeota archaeon]|nr:winged helix-turn-helix transcriptional regulator [Candidatus Lokiarchaeota archaeon]
MESKVFKIDEVDKNIIEIIQKEPMLTHTEIAKKVNRSQPTIGMRIRKLEKSGVLKFQAGINVKTMDLLLARVEIQTLNPDKIVNLVKNCPYMLNAFRLSGASNYSILVVSNKLAHLDDIVNHHFRKDSNVSEVSMDIITDVTNDFVLTFDFNFENCGLTSNNQCCGKCCS